MVQEACYLILGVGYPCKSICTIWVCPSYYTIQAQSVQCGYYPGRCSHLPVMKEASQVKKTVVIKGPSLLFVLLK